MANIRFDNFTGIFPREGTKRLPLGAAITASNTRFDGGRLHSVKGLLDVNNVPSSTNSIFKHSNQYWLTSSGTRHYVQSPVIQDTHDRVYIAGGDFPVYATASTGYAGFNAAQTIAEMPRLPSLSYRLGLPGPGSAPTVSVTALPAAEADVETLLDVEITLSEGQSVSDWVTDNLSQLTTAYVYTYVSDYGEESAPSAPSSLVDYYDGQQKTITIPSDLGSGFAIASAKKRIYRIATGTSASEYLFVAEVTYATTSFTDTTVDVQLSEPLTTTNHLPPPNDDLTVNPSGPLKSLVQHPQGFLVGHTGRTLCFSEPYLPHAWNPNNQITVPSDIIGLCAFSQGILVATKRRPYLLSGNAPSSMDIVPFENEQACTSDRSIVEVGGGVIFASHDGLVAVSGGQAVLITEKHFDRETWARFYPSSIHAYCLDTRYIGFYTSSDNLIQGGFVYETTTGRFSELTDYAQAGFVDPEDDILYLVQGTDLKQFERGDLLEYTWKSGEIRLHDSILFQRYKIEADHNVSMRIQIDGEDFYARTVLDSASGLLPSGMRGEVFTIQVKGSGSVDLISIADDSLDLEP